MIKEIKIENFKSIKELTLNLNPINILIGPNGAGKSNFINFFGLVYAIYDKQLGIYTADKGGADKILHLGRRYSTNLLGAIDFDSTNEYAFSLAPNEQNNFYFLFESDKFNKAKGGLGGWGWSERIYSRGHNEALIREISDTRSMYVKSYLQSFRVYHFHDTSKNSPLKQNARIEDNRFLRTDGSNIAAFLYNLQQNHPKSYNQIEATIKLIATYFDRFELIKNGGFIRLIWRQIKTDIYLDASDLSDGTLRFIALCTLLLQPKLPGTIIIDEPELGLHPYAINILAGLIKSVSKKSQIIISTQSVNLIDNFEPEDIIVVENSENESHFKRLNSEELEVWLADYSIGELWNKNVLGGNP